jgi:hypothetical protein
MYHSCIMRACIIHASSIHSFAPQDSFRRSEGVATLRACLSYSKEDALVNSFLIMAVVVGGRWQVAGGRVRSFVRARAWVGV